MRLEAQRSAIEAAGGQLLALSSDASEKITSLLSKLSDEGTPLGFPVLSDPSRAAIKALGVYDAEHDIGLPAVMIIDREGTLRWQYVGENVTDRPAEQALVDALKSLASP